MSEKCSYCQNSYLDKSKFVCDIPESRRNDFTDWLDRRNEIEVFCPYGGKVSECKWMNENELEKEVKNNG